MSTRHGGMPRTFWRDGVYDEVPYWHWGAEPPRQLAGWKRWAAAAAAGAAVLAVAYGLAVNLPVTERALAWAAGIAGAAGCVRWLGRLQEWRHYRSTVRPFGFAVAPSVGQSPAAIRSWLHIPQNFQTDEDTRIVIDVPPDFTGADRDMEDIARAVTVKLSIEAPEVDKKLHSRAPCLIYTRCHPPPDMVTWEDVEKYMTVAGPDDLVVGLGDRRKLVKASLSEDSPHFGISMGSGAGKSNLATFWLLQELRRGAMALILDAKFFSYPWAFKDMDAEFGLLPNIRYCRRTEDLHNAMLWLGDELARRTIFAERVIDAGGDLHGDVGPRLFVICEEMNLAEERLKLHWAGTRGKDQPKRSPAFSGLGAVAYAGRAVKMHLVLIGQQLTAAAVGGGAIRENVGVKCLSRYSPNTWKMQVGDVAMPPAPWTPGRVQCVAGGVISQAQTPWLLKNPGMDGDRIRALATGGVVTACPPGMPGGASELVTTGAGHLGGASQGGSEQAFDIRPETPSLVHGTGPAGAMKLAEAVAEGLFVSIVAARKAAYRQGWEPAGGDRYTGFTYSRKDIYAYARARRGDDR